MTSTATAVPVEFNLVFDGAKEIDGSGNPNAGDLDGVGFGTLTLDTAPGIYGEIDWNFTYSNIDPPTAMHIHGPGGFAGTSVSVAIGLGTTTSGGPGTLIHSFDDGNWPGSFQKGDIAALINNPTAFYVNIHNPAFGGGAIRGQLPEPATCVLLSLGSLALLRRRRRA